MAIFGFLSMVAGLVGTFFSLIWVVMYVLRGIGLYKMCVNTGIERAWMAWVPFLHEYQCARIGDRTRIAQGKTPFLERGLVVAAVLYVVVRLLRPVMWDVFFIGILFRIVYGIISVVVYAVSVAADYWLYADFEPLLATVYTILSAVQLGGIAKFLIRDNVPTGVAGVCSPRQPKYGPGTPNQPGV